MTIFIREEINHVEPQVKLHTLNVPVRAVTLVILFRRFNETYGHGTQCTDQGEDSLLLNALTTVVEVVIKARYVGNFNLPHIDGPFRGVSSVERSETSSNGCT